MKESQSKTIVVLKKGLRLKIVNKHQVSKEKCAEAVDEKLQETPERKESYRTSSESLNLRV